MCKSLGSFIGDQIGDVDGKETSFESILEEHRRENNISKGLNDALCYVYDELSSDAETDIAIKLVEEMKEENQKIK